MINVTQMVSEYGQEQFYKVEFDNMLWACLRHHMITVDNKGFLTAVYPESFD